MRTRFYFSVLNMNRCYLNPSVKFKRVEGLVRAVCEGTVSEGDIVCYEIPAKSTDQSFKRDIFRYTMQCVYSGESLFPCAFNQEVYIPDKNKVFFDYVFRTEYKREISEKLALALYAHNRTNPPFLFKTLGIFQSGSSGINCLRVSYDNGETFLVASSNLQVGDILRTSLKSFKVPSKEQEFDSATAMEFVSDVDLSDVDKFTNALSSRGKAEDVRPEGRVVHVNKSFDPDLDKRLAKYQIDREMGISEFYVQLGRLNREGRGDHSLDTIVEMEELYNVLNEEFESGK